MVVMMIKRLHSQECMQPHNKEKSQCCGRQANRTDDDDDGGGGGGDDDDDDDDDDGDGGGGDDDDDGGGGDDGEQSGRSPTPSTARSSPRWTSTPKVGTDAGRQAGRQSSGV